MLTYLSNFFQLLVAFSTLHPIHVTVTEIELDEKDKRLEIMMRVFIDDFETTLRNTLKQPTLDILHPKNGQTRDQIIEFFLKDRFKVTLDNKSQALKYLGHEQDGDAFVLYIEGPNVKKFRTITVYNDILTNEYDDQSNLVHVTVRGKVKSLRLTPDNISDQLTFDTK
ncbi:MAG TPA: DUF6702 family protein [Chryseosolibacter sp.]|nr:DUF6702 family protein [Chryseosolibacter sp.]